MEHRVQIWERDLFLWVHVTMVGALCSVVQYDGIVTSLQIDVRKWLRVPGVVRQDRRTEWFKALGSRLWVVL